jgi:hypothetical protein
LKNREETCVLRISERRSAPDLHYGLQFRFTGSFLLLIFPAELGHIAYHELQLT